MNNKLLIQVMRLVFLPANLGFLFSIATGRVGLGIGFGGAMFLLTLWGYVEPA